MKWKEDLIKDIKIGYETHLEKDTDDTNNCCKKLFNKNFVGPPMEFSHCNQYALKKSFLKIKN